MPARSLAGLMGWVTRGLGPYPSPTAGPAQTKLTVAPATSTDPFTPGRQSTPITAHLTFPFLLTFCDSLDSDIKRNRYFRILGLIRLGDPSRRDTPALKPVRFPIRVRFLRVDPGALISWSHGLPAHCVEACGTGGNRWPRPSIH
ncbi:hypothetical protein N7510_008495 [Penicillium lagena]|uniref:uncharacterized protein n=1 Tax=Penicillium lagena TaxID=94218 RepID=UPI0025425E4F|nr:uncharacterized protein N7510_008495 [Penicillium lagena]KAJ5605714.1 hypothetical protein N7510_008495 [Penicillium lagena]